MSTKGPEDSKAARSEQGLHQAVCVYLGREGDPATQFLQPHAAHRCFATEPEGRIELSHQVAHCFSACEACPRYLAPVAPGIRATPRPVGTEALAQPIEAPAEAGAASAAAERARRVGQALREAGGPGLEIGEAWRRRFSRLSFEEALVYGITATLLVVIGYFAFLSGPDDAMKAALPPSAAATITVEAARENAPSPTPEPSATASPTSRPTKRAAAPALPTPPEGGLMAALSPAERGVGTFSEAFRLPEYGERNLRVGSFEGQRYIGGLLFPLNKIPSSSRVSYVALEIAGLSESQLAEDGEWTVEMLDPDAADTWSDMTYSTLAEAPAEQARRAWRLPASELAARKINVLEFSDDALDLFIQRLPQGRIAFRITGPGAGQALSESERRRPAAARSSSAAQGPDNLFIWDTGYGDGFGTRPVLRVGFVPPTPTPGPARDESGNARPTAPPFIVWISDPTPAPLAPTATPFPMGLYGRVQGMILFYSDRFKPREGRFRDPSAKRAPGLANPERQLMVYDPATGRIGQVTQSWPATLANRLKARAADVTVSVGPSNQLVIRDQYSEGPRDLTGSGDNAHYDPAVSPDGEWIVFVSNETGNDEIYKVRRNGEDKIRLTDNSWEWDKHPSWSPDGSQIVFWSNREGRNQLYIMNADGGEVRNISGNAYNDWDPVWLR